jgi:hypothetical protein
MDGLVQIEILGKGEGWSLVGLDREGRVWYGTILSAGPGRRRVRWVRMEEDVSKESVEGQ